MNDAATSPAPVPSVKLISLCKRYLRLFRNVYVGLEIAEELRRTDSYRVLSPRGFEDTHEISLRACWWCGLPA